MESCGISDVRNTLVYKLDMWHRMIILNFLSYTQCLQIVLPYMPEKNWEIYIFCRFNSCAIVFFPYVKQSNYFGNEIIYYHAHELF